MARSPRSVRGPPDVPACALTCPPRAQLAPAHFMLCSSRLCSFWTSTGTASSQNRSVGPWHVQHIDFSLETQGFSLGPSDSILHIHGTNMPASFFTCPGPPTIVLLTTVPILPFKRTECPYGPWLCCCSRCAVCRYCHIGSSPMPSTASGWIPSISSGETQWAS